MKNKKWNNRLAQRMARLLIIYLATSCVEERTVYHDFSPLPDKGWMKKDTLVFQTEKQPPSILNLFVEVRNQYDYPYKELYLSVSQNLQDSIHFQTDTIQLVLTDSSGNWTGKGWGFLYSSEKFVKSVRTLNGGECTVKIASVMKDSLLQGINDIGVRIERQ